jgi:hypothetical protein
MYIIGSKLVNICMYCNNHIDIEIDLTIEDSV